MRGGTLRKTNMSVIGERKNVQPFSPYMQKKRKRIRASVCKNFCNNADASYCCFLKRCKNTCRRVLYCCVILFALIPALSYRCNNACTITLLRQYVLHKCLPHHTALHTILLRTVPLHHTLAAYILPAPSYLRHRTNPPHTYYSIILTHPTAVPTNPSYCSIKHMLLYSQRYCSGTLLHNNAPQYVLLHTTAPQYYSAILPQNACRMMSSQKSPCGRGGTGPRYPGHRSHYRRKQLRWQALTGSCELDRETKK